LAPHGKEAFYRKFLQPVVDAYRGLGIAAHYRPVNDIVAGGRKISGNGAAEIEGYLILVGNLILDFNYDMMAQVLKVPDEKFRDKVYKTMQENLTTIKRELGMVPPRQELERLLVRHFERLLGPLERGSLDEPLREVVAQLAERFQSEEWLYQKGRTRRDWATKIAAGVEVKQKVYKAPGGLIRATVVEKEGVIDSLSLSGDFFFYPQDKLEDLERALVGVKEGEVEEAIVRFYEENAIESPGVGPTDWAQAITIER
jgi:lipoate-protein ligase A